MHGSYLVTNLKNLEVGDKLTVTQVYKGSVDHLTIDKEYTVLLIKTNAERSFKDKFCIVTDAGKKRWYNYKNMMFKLVKKSGQYNSEQKYLMHEFVRGIESCVQAWNQLIDNKDRDSLYEESRDSMIDEYLIKINKANK